MEPPEKSSRNWPGWMLLGLLALYLITYLVTVIEDLFELNLF